MTYRIEKRRGWSVVAPGGRQWMGAPSQLSAFELARSLAGIDAMLALINRPALALPPAYYGLHVMPGKAR